MGWIRLVLTTLGCVMLVHRIGDHFRYEPTNERLLPLVTPIPPPAVVPKPPFPEAPPRVHPPAEGKPIPPQASEARIATTGSKEEDNEEESYWPADDPKEPLTEAEVAALDRTCPPFRNQSLGIVGPLLASLPRGPPQPYTLDTRKYFRKPGSGPLPNDKPRVDFWQRFIEEKGAKRLIRDIEHALDFTDSSPCVRRQYWDGADPDKLCIRPDMLQLTRTPASLREMTHPKGVPQFTAAHTDRTKLRFGSKQFPYLAGSIFRHTADEMYETYSHYWWGRGATHYKHATFKANFSRVYNRSVLYWNLNPYFFSSLDPKYKNKQGDGSDIDVLKHVLDTGVLKHHFFLVFTNQDKGSYPSWLLEHPLLLKLFTINVTPNMTHPKIVPIPLGIEPVKASDALNRYRSVAGLHKPARTLWMKMNTRNHPERQVLVDRLARFYPYVVTAGCSMLRRQYYEHFLNHKFVLAPPGNGIDTFRTYEALYLGRIPVVLNGTLRQDLFQDLPIAWIDKWDDLNPQWFREAERKLSGKVFNLDKLWAIWWLLYMLREILATP